MSEDKDVQLVAQFQKQYQELQKRANDDLQIKQEELLSPLPVSYTHLTLPTTPYV